MKLVGLDVGDRRIGVAASELPGVVVPIGVVQRGPNELEVVRRIVAEREIDRVIVGLPTGRKGEVGPQAQRVLEFVERLRAAVCVPVETWDESLSTLEAEEALIAANVSRARRHRLIDAEAAAVILRSYVEANP